MINEKVLNQINEKIEARNRMRHILRGFESPYVEITVGLVCVNSASKHETDRCDDANWLHRKMPQIEAALKERAGALLRLEMAVIDAWLSERNVG